MPLASNQEWQSAISGQPERSMMTPGGRGIYLKFEELPMRFRIIDRPLQRRRMGATYKVIRAVAVIAAGLLMVSNVAAQMKPVVDQPTFRTIELWPDGAPGATGTTDEDKPAIIPFLPAEAKQSGAAVLICPGGAFTTRAADHEGILVAQWLKARGVAGFVLRYRLTPLYTRQDALQDAQRGLQYIRAHAAEYHLSPNRIGIIGFSAGAELACDAAFQPLRGQPEAADRLARVSSRPDYVILSYGSSPLSAAGAENQLPPTFMFCTAEDAGHLKGMVDLYASLRQAKTSVEAHFFVNGEHGVGLAQGDPVLGEWPNLMFKWMISSGFLVEGPRVAITGLVKLDGAPLVRGIVILTPVEKTLAPPVVAYITNTGTGPLGQFIVNQSQGPVPGRYRVEVRQEATRWMSNSRDSVMIRMMTKARNKTLTDEERKEWGEYIRKRDLSPSIEDQRRFHRQRPKAKTDYLIEIHQDSNAPLNIEVFSH
jgi:acetyl esterase/lipase